MKKSSMRLACRGGKGGREVLKAKGIAGVEGGGGEAGVGGGEEDVSLGVLGVLWREGRGRDVFVGEEGVA